MKRPRLIKDRLKNRDAIIENLQASEFERLNGMKRLSDTARKAIEERTVIALERVKARRMGEAK